MTSSRRQETRDESPAALQGADRNDEIVIFETEYAASKASSMRSTRAQWHVELDFRKDEITSIWLQTADLPGKQSIEHDDRICLRFAVQATNINAAANRAFRIIADATAHLSGTRMMATRIWTAGEKNCLPELVGLSEIAEILDVTRQRAGQLARRIGFPPSVAKLAMGPVYTRHDIEDYALKNNRKICKLNRSKRFQAE